MAKLKKPSTLPLQKFQEVPLRQFGCTLGFGLELSSLFDAWRSYAAVLCLCQLSFLIAAATKKDTEHGNFCKKAHHWGTGSAKIESFKRAQKREQRSALTEIQQAIASVN